MPTYQYVCKKCGHELEELQSMTERPLVRCPQCNTDSLARVVSAGSGLIFKGSGFYLTDYKKGAKSKGKEKGAKEEKSTEKGTEKKETPSDTSSSSAKPPPPSSSSAKNE